MDVGTAVFRAVADFSAVRSEADSAATSLQGVSDAAGGVGDAASGSTGEVESATSAWGDRLTGVAEKMEDTGQKASLALTLPIVAAGGLGIKTFQDFDTAITQAGLKAGATEDQMAAMRDMAIDMGATTVFSAVESAAGFDELASAGFTAEQAMGALPGVMLAAQAANEDLGLTSQIVASSINAFGLEAEDATKVADIMASAANTTALDMQGLGEAMASAGQLGTSANQDLSDVVATVGRLVDAGVPAASAGTAIVQAVSSLQAPSKSAAKVMDQLGLSVRDANGEMLPLPQMLGNLDDSLKATNPQFAAMAAEMGMSETQARDWALSQMMGVEGMKAVSIAMSDAKPVIIDTAAETEKMAQMAAGLEQTLGKDAADAFIAAHTSAGVFTASGADAVQALAGLTAGSEGTAAAFGEAFNETLGAQIDQFKGSLETLSIKVLTAVMPAIKSLTGFVTTLVEKFANFSESHPGLTQIGVLALAAAAAFGPMLIVIAQVLKSIVAIRTFVVLMKSWVIWTKIAAAAQWLWNAALSANPIGLIILAIAALVAGLIWFFTQTETGKKIWAAAWAGIQAAVQWVVDWFKTSVIPFFQMMWGLIKIGWSTLVGLVSGYFQIWLAVITTALNAIRAIWDAVWAAVSGTISIFVGFVMGVINGFIEGIKSIIRGGMNIIKGIFSGNFEQIKTGIGQILGGVITLFTNLPGNVLKALGAVGTLLYDTGKNLMQGLLNGIKNLAGTVKDAILGPISDGWNSAKSFLGIASPSKLMAEMGRFTMQGFAEGIVREEAHTVASVEGAAVAVVDAFAPAVAGLNTSGPITAGMAPAALSLGPTPGNAAPTLATTQGLAGAQIGVLQVNNPKPEPVGTTLAKQVRKTASIGVSA